MDGQRAREQATHEPCRPSAAADPRRAVCALPLWTTWGTWASIEMVIPAIPRISNGSLCLVADDASRRFPARVREQEADAALTPPQA